MERGPFGLEVEKMRGGWLSGSGIESLRVRKALRCHLASPPPKVIQLISVIECASRYAAMPS